MLGLVEEVIVSWLNTGCVPPRGIIVGEVAANARAREEGRHSKKVGCRFFSLKVKSSVLKFEIYK
jgi:hypothetical protein